ncbi:unnamed protein product, partial [Citrullus colocynthis]
MSIVRPTPPKSSLSLPPSRVFVSANGLNSPFVRSFPPHVSLFDIVHGDLAADCSHCCLCCRLQVELRSPRSLSFTPLQANVDRFLAPSPVRLLFYSLSSSNARSCRFLVENLL